VVVFKLIQSFDVFSVEKNKLLQDRSLQFQVRALQVERFFWYTRLDRFVPHADSWINQTT